MNVLDKDKDKEMTYFEENATRILDRKNISKAQFAKEMGVAPQNINKLFGTKNIYTLSKISTFLDIPLDVLLYGVRTSKKSIQGCVFIDGQEHIIKSKEDIQKLLEIV